MNYTFDEMVIDRICNIPEQYLINLDDFEFGKWTIIDVEVIVPNKVVKVSFPDGVEKLVCEDCDDFSLNNALFIAIAKHMYKEDYIPEGYYNEAFNELMYRKDMIKNVNHALKVYKKKQKDISILEEETEAFKRRKDKKAAYKNRRAERRRQEQINIQKEAYIQAMEYINKKQ